MSTLVTQQAPDFSATAVMADDGFEEIRLSDYRGKYVVLFFYPLDFTFVCPSEIIAFDKSGGVQGEGRRGDRASRSTRTSPIWRGRTPRSRRAASARSSTRWSPT